jgi:hypothetical protein
VPARRAADLRRNVDAALAHVIDEEPRTAARAAN